MAKAIPAPPIVSPLQSDLLDERLRLIGREASIDAAARPFIDRIIDSWARELRAALKTGKIDGATRQRIASIAAKAGRLTAPEIAALEKALGPILRDVYTQTAYRQVHILDTGVFQTVESARGVSFNAINSAATARALGQRIPGLDRTVTFKNVSKAAEGRMRRDLADAIASGFDLQKLISKWTAGGGAGSIRNDAISIARTAMHSAANEATVAVYRQNPKLIRAVRWEATFDVRTCLQCSSQHGREYLIADAPALPAHFRCRCVWLPVFADASIDKLISAKAAYITKGGAVRFRKADRRFETWLRGQPVTARADFFPSALKRRAWENGWLSLPELVAPDGSTLTDVEVLAKLQRRGIKP